ncbi:MAG: hypothetical protein J0H83_19790 [Candidatus Melainabacteria bacterium]|nr:hypothetical protein [Candidatus Melainabacteria bacterium]
MEDFRCHNYTRDASRWGWAIVRFDFLTDSTVQVAAFGFNKNVVDGKTVEIPIEPGELIALSMPDGTALYEIMRISYKFNPDDLYEADLKYVQHLTGIRIVGIGSDREKHARALAWGQMLRASEASGSDA